MASSSGASQSGPGSQNRLIDDHVLLGDLDISFRRTIRVLDNHQLSQLPPDLGPFPLFQVRDYACKLPAEMATKGRLFMPMYQREAMWINLASTHQYAIKVYVGAVNAVSGEPAVETAATQLRRRNNLAQGQPIQDYVVVPDQRWLDGITTAVGQVRQFVATPMGSGRSIETQITGEDVVGGIQFEITPRILETAARAPGTILIFAKSTDGRSIPLYVHRSETVSELKSKIEDAGRTGSLTFARLLFGPKTMLEDRTLEYYNINQHSTITIIDRLTGGGGPPPDAGVISEMNLAPGGRIEQNIAKDPHRSSRQQGSSSTTAMRNTNKDKEIECRWDSTKTVTFNVQILNTAAFARITGLQPPETPVNAAEYAQQGVPFFTLPNDPETDVAGEFTSVQSVAQLEGAFDPVVNPKINLMGHKMAGKGPNPPFTHSQSSASNAATQPAPSPRTDHIPAKTNLGADFFNPAGPRAPFRSVGDLEREMGRMTTVRFR